MEKITKDELIRLVDEVADTYIGKSVKQCNNRELFLTICQAVKRKAFKLHSDEIEKISKPKKTVYYFSMEFLIGRLLQNYLINLGIEDVARETLLDYGIDIEEIYKEEFDPGLGNGGLGRLAACFLDSMAAENIYGIGMGLMYRFGLFRQTIEHGFQIENADDWIKKGKVWGTKKDSLTTTIKFGGYVDKIYKDGKINFEYKGYDEILAVPYDIPIIGYNNNKINCLRLWSSVPKDEKFDLTAFNQGDYAKAAEYRTSIEAISYILYPDDSNAVGKRLRLQQEYLLVSAGIQNIVKTYKQNYGNDSWFDFPSRIQIHINDTHPTMCIPELLRVLMDDEHLEWDDAWDITTKTIAYTNHTVMPEALEKWPIDLMQKHLPRIYMLIEEIDKRFKDSVPTDIENRNELIKETAILWDGQVKMANLSCIAAHSINGVAALHTDIIKKETLSGFNILYPQKFNNKTNGVTHRRFLLQANPELANVITSKIGDSWKKDASQLEKLLQLKDDEDLLLSLEEIRFTNKLKLAKYIEKHNKICVDPTSVFDIQVKRIHAYKRQLLNIFKIMYLYNELKENPNLDINPYTFIMSGKAANSYTFAKKTIKLFNNLADIVNNDNAINGKLKMAFIENFCVTNAQYIYPAADISEQISTAGKEASGTGNMKFMFNGAITLGTLDGANVEIHNLVGDDNMQLFGLKENEITEIRKNNSYNPSDFVEQNPKIKKIVEQLINGFFDIYPEEDLRNIDPMTNKKVDYWDIYDSLMKYNDEYFVLYDLKDYMDKFFLLDKKFRERKIWNQMSLTNIAKAGYFSSDRTIREYAEEIWKI